MSTDDGNTAAMVTDLATAAELIHAVARDARSTAPELEAPDLYTLGAVLDELTGTLAHIAEQCAAATGNCCWCDQRIAAVGAGRWAVA